MSLIKSPVRSAALLARCRSNAQHSTGPRTSEGKARSCLNALRHGRRSRTLYRVLPRGLCFDDRMLFNWVHRAIRNSFPPQTPRHEAKVRRTALQVWLQTRLEVEGKNDHRSMYLMERQTFLNNSKPRNCFQLESNSPRGMLTFRTIEQGPIPRRRVGPTVARASCLQAEAAEQNTGWKPALRSRVVRAVWRGETKVQDWQHEPYPLGETDAITEYHWKRFREQVARAAKRGRARWRRQAAGAVADLRDAVRDLDEARRAGPPTSSASPWGRLGLSAGSLPATAPSQSPSAVGSSSGESSQPSCSGDVLIAEVSSLRGGGGDTAATATDVLIAEVSSLQGGGGDTAATATDVLIAEVSSLRGGGGDTAATATDVLIAEVSSLQGGGGDTAATATDVLIAEVSSLQGGGGDTAATATDVLIAEVASQRGGETLPLQRANRPTTAWRFL